MMKQLASGMAQTLLLKLIQSKIDMFIISDQLCLSVLIFCAVSVIGISVKNHIGTSLISIINIPANSAVGISPSVVIVASNLIK